MNKIKVIATNRKAFHDYFILHKYEAGIVLEGPEVKSIREGKISLKDSFARIEDGQIYLHNMHISPYEHARIEELDARRTRKLLLKKQEIRKLIGQIQEKGYTFIPLKLYFKNQFAKIELGLAKGKKIYDKRRVIAEKTAQREIQRELRQREK